MCVCLTLAPEVPPLAAFVPRYPHAGKHKYECHGTLPAWVSLCPGAGVGVGGRTGYEMAKMNCHPFIN